MIVIKKTGLKEDFSIGKLRHSVQAANSKTDEMLNIDTFAKNFEDIIAEKTTISTQQIDIIVYGLLYSKGHVQTLINYISYEK